MAKKIDKTKIFTKIVASLLAIMMILATGGTLIYYLFTA